MRILDGSTQVGLQYDTTSSEEVIDLCEQTYDGRLFDPLTDPGAPGALQGLRESWDTQGHTVVFTSGAYDLGPHRNHLTFLKSMRIIAAPFHYARHEAETAGRPWEALSRTQRGDYVRRAIGSDGIKLVVSVDGDAALDVRKSGDPAKGSTRRPFFGWDTRARGVLDLCDVIDGGAHAVVDAVTMHDNQLPELAGTPHAGIMEIGAHVQPDVWGIFFESEDVIGALAQDRTGAYHAISPVILSHAGLYKDKYAGLLSTSGIARHVGGSVLQRTSQT